MKKNLRGKIREYIQSEDGKVGVKSPLTLGRGRGSSVGSCHCWNTTGRGRVVQGVGGRMPYELLLSGSLGLG